MRDRGSRAPRSHYAELQMELTLGERFTLPHESWKTRRVIWREGSRPVGHLTYGDPSGAVDLWLQNYAGYYNPQFVLNLKSEAIALKRAAEILKEWDTNSERPTYIA